AMEHRRDVSGELRGGGVSGLLKKLEKHGLLLESDARLPSVARREPWQMAGLSRAAGRRSNWKGACCVERAEHTACGAHGKRLRRWRRPGAATVAAPLVLLR
ncbi:MAG: hypothetical protein ACREV1_18280, partial [Gammaproteobacteria bacterium]